MKATYINHMGDDLTVVNNARVSFANVSEELSEKDKGLINFLARGMSKKDWDATLEDLMEMSAGALKHDCCHDEMQDIVHHLKSLPTHWAPFANGTTIQFHIRAPVPIMRQVYKHKVGSVESEESRRYIGTDPLVYYPDFRYQSKDKKQGSSDDLVYDQTVYEAYSDAVDIAISAYYTMIGKGVSFEQARFVLPQGTMLQSRVSNSLYGWWNLCNQRNDPHAQKEVQDLAKQIDATCRELYPVSWEALNTY